MSLLSGESQRPEPLSPKQKLELALAGLNNPNDYSGEDYYLSAVMSPNLEQGLKALDQQTKKQLYDKVVALASDPSQFDTTRVHAWNVIIAWKGGKPIKYFPDSIKQQCWQDVLSVLQANKYAKAVGSALNVYDAAYDAVPKKQEKALRQALTNIAKQSSDTNSHAPRYAYKTSALLERPHGLAKKFHELAAFLNEEALKLVAVLAVPFVLIPMFIAHRYLRVWQSFVPHIPLNSKLVNNFVINNNTSQSLFCDGDRGFDLTVNGQSETLRLLYNPGKIPSHFDADRFIDVDITYRKASPKYLGGGSIAFHQEMSGAKKPFQTTYYLENMPAGGAEVFYVLEIVPPEKTRKLVIAAQEVCLSRWGKPPRPSRSNAALLTRERTAAYKSGANF